MPKNYNYKTYNADNMYNLGMTTESRLLKNRSNLLRSLGNLPIEDLTAQDLRSQLNVMRKDLKAKNLDRLRQYVKSADDIIEDDTGRAFEAGKQKGLNEVTTEVNGNITKAENKRSKATEKVTKQIIRQSATTSFKQQDNDFKLLSGILIASLVLNKRMKTNKKLFDLVDEANSQFTDVVGKVTKDKKQLTLSSYTQTITKEQTNDIYNAGVGSITEQAREDDLVYVPAHGGSCPLCTPWEDKFLVDDINREGRQPKGRKYPTLSFARSKGFQHFNCRHPLTDAPPGFNKPKFNEDIRTNKSGSINQVKRKQAYDLQLKQRAYERNIRKYKQREANALTEQGRLSANRLVRIQQAKIRGLQKQAKENNVRFFRQPHREQISFKWETFKPI